MQARILIAGQENSYKAWDSAVPLGMGEQSERAVFAEGHPVSVMDMSFANHALCCEYLVKNHKTLEHKVYPVPDELDKKAARLNWTPWASRSTV